MCKKRSNQVEWMIRPYSHRAILFLSPFVVILVLCATQPPRNCRLIQRYWCRTMTVAAGNELGPDQFYNAVIGFPFRWMCKKCVPSLPRAFRWDVNVIKRLRHFICLFSTFCQRIGLAAISLQCSAMGSCPWSRVTGLNVLRGNSY